MLVVRYYTGAHGKPVHETARYAQSGPALGILTGFSYGMESTVWAKYILGAVVLLAWLMGGGGLAGIYYIAAASMGLKEMKGIIMAGDAFGPIADNSAGISEMVGLSEETRASGHALDAVGNVTKALAKGYAMSAATVGKGTDTHASAVVGDTFGDPLKDTAGPSLHILVKLQNIISITLLPLFVEHGLKLFQ